MEVPRSMGDRLSAREESILLGLLMTYLETREPVASRTLASGCAQGLSPATVRAILSRLEEAGYLHQPHTSAGRLPTEQAYRHFAQRVLSQSEADADPGWAEIEEVSVDGSLNGVARRVSNALAQMVHSVGFAVTPSEAAVRLRSCELVSIRPDRVLWVVVSTAGQVLESVLRTSEPYTHEELRWFSNYLSETYSGWSFSEMRHHLKAQVGLQEAECRREVRQALQLVAPFFLEAAPGRELFWDGASWLFETPELTENLRAVRTLLESLQRKSQLLDLLEALGQDRRGLRVVLGGDWPDPAARGLAMVAAPFGAEDLGYGVVGIIGPEALRYDKTIPLVRRAARLATLASAKLHG
jgi:heat-inducible transcriptional repressor